MGCLWQQSWHLYAIKTPNGPKFEVITPYYSSQPENGLESPKYTKIQALKMIIYMEDQDRSFLP